MQPDPLFETQAKLLECIKQRDSALDNCLNKSAQLALAGRRIGELQDLVAELQKQIETLHNQMPKDVPVKECE